jgi:hypothetical protein
MRSIGYRQNREHFECPVCPNTWPPQEDSGEAQFVQDFEP